MPSGSRADEELLEHVRRTYCRKCKLSFVCLIGRRYRECFWCLRCKGWWLVDHDMFVRCVAFPGTRDKEVGDGGMIQESRMSATIEDCPLCNNQGENPLEIIDGFLEEDYRGRPRWPK